MKFLLKTLGFAMLLSMLVGCGSGGESKKSEVKSVDVLGTKNVNIKKDGGTLGLSLATYDKDGKFIEQKLDKNDVKITKSTVQKITKTRSINDIIVKIDVMDSSFVNNSDKVKNIVIDIDSTGSMLKNDPYDQRKDAAKKLLDVSRKSDDKIMIAEFAEYTSQLTDFTNDNNILKDAIDQIGSFGATYMNKSLLELENLLKDRDGSRSIVVLTDGKTFDLEYHSDVINMAKQEDITIYTIALGDDFDSIENLKELSDKTGGMFAKIKDPSGLEKIYKNFGISAIKGSSVIVLKFTPPKDLEPGYYILHIEGTAGSVPFKKDVEFEIK